MTSSKGNSNPISSDEQRLFREAIGSVNRLAVDRVAPEAPRPAPVPAQRIREERAVIEEMAAGRYDPSELETGDELLFAQGAVQRRQFQKLRRGEYSVGAELDLHGMTVPVAREALARFISRSISAGYRCVRIVHGKGHGSFNRQPVLKSKLGRWLRQRKDILAFCSARPVDGGTGAIYVLVRRPSRGG